MRIASWSIVQWIFLLTTDPAPWWSQAGRSREGSAHRGRPEFGAALKFPGLA
jgi:hypothetical protein